MHQECMVGNELFLEEDSEAEILQLFLFQSAPLTFAAHLWVLKGSWTRPQHSGNFFSEKWGGHHSHISQKSCFPSVLDFSVITCALPSIFILLPHQTKCRPLSGLTMLMPLTLPCFQVDGKVEVSTRSPRGNGHSIVPLPFPLTGKDMQVAWAEVFHAWWEVQGKSGFICSTF